MTKTTNSNGMILYTINCTVTPILQGDKLSGNIDLEDFSSIKLSQDIIIQFYADVYRRMNHTNEVVKENEPWLVELNPLHGNLFQFSVGGEYLDDITISELKKLLKTVIFIN